jgi:type I restriction enzyme S subunit
LASAGATRNALTKVMIENFEIKAPEIDEQIEIASILSSLDDKIELNLQMNQTLEAMAQAIFKEWFVNFNFPGFDGELVNGLPKGWKMGKLNEVCKIEIGRTPPRMEEHWFSTDPKDIKWISIRDLGLAGVYIFNTYEYLTKEAVEKFRIPIIPANTVVLSFKLTIGRLAITTETMLSNEAIAQIKSDIFSTEYIYTYLKTYNWGTLGSTSSIATAINSKIIKEMEILIPENSVEKKFQEVIKPIFEKLKANSQEIETLTQIRDSLLPKLMTGKIEIQA